MNLLYAIISVAVIGIIELGHVTWWTNQQLIMSCWSLLIAGSHQCQMLTELTCNFFKFWISLWTVFHDTVQHVRNDFAALGLTDSYCCTQARSSKFIYSMCKIEPACWWLTICIAFVAPHLYELNG